MAVLSVGLGIIVLDGTIVGVALPSVITDQQLNPTQAQWVNSLYAVLLAALLLRRARFAGTWGRKRAFLTGLTIFVEGSVLAGFLPPPPLTSARAVQAIGAAFVMPSTLSTVNAVFRGKYRAAAFGVWGAVISGAAALGLLAGGALTEWVSWYSRLSRPDLGWWEPQSSFSFFGWTWSENAPISPVPVALAVSAVGFALSAMAIGAFSPVQQPPRRGAFRGTRHRAHRARLGSRRRPYPRPAYGAGYEWLDYRRAADPVWIGPWVRLRNAEHRASGAVVQALSEGLTIAAQWSLVAANAFLALGFVGALRVRRAAGEKGAPASNADLGARFNRVPN